MALVKVVAVQDEDCHWYVIPADREDQFYVIEEMCSSIDDCEIFQQVFGKYATGGDLNLVQLYADFDQTSNSFK